MDRDNPWPGLAPFTEEQSGMFYGRDQEIRDLTRRTERNALTVLFGQSGLGKSSLLQAGVFPRLRADGYWPIYIRLDHGPGAPPPAEQIKLLVHADTARAGSWTKPGSAKPSESLWEFFHHRDDRLVTSSGRVIVPVLVFDQFEELFTLGAGSGSERARAVAFMSELAELVENRPSEPLVARLEESSAEMEAFDFSRTDYRVVITLREDYLPHLESLKTAMPALMENRMRLARMTGMQALEAVVKPGGALVTEEVARAIVEFVAGARGGSVERLAELDVEPPLLSVICRELNERRRALGHGQITADLVSGNRREILTDFYERSVTDLPGEMRMFVEDHLLTKSGFRDNFALETALEFSGVTRPLIDTLVARRLLRIEDRMGLQRVELTHDVLAEVIRASRDARQQRIALEEARKHEERVLAAAARNTRRQRWVIAALGMAVIGLSIGAFFGIRAQLLVKKRASQSDSFIASKLLGEGKTGDALAYLVRAARRDPQNAVLAPRILSELAHHSFLLPEGAPLALPSPALGFGPRYSADGKRIFVQGEDGVIRVIDTATWQVAREFSFGQKVVPYNWSLASKNDGVLAVGLEDGSILVCDTGTGQPLSPPIRPKDSQLTERLKPILSPDGRWVAAANNSTCWLWDAGTGEQRAVFQGYGTNRGLFVFSPDSRIIATGQGSYGNRPMLWTVPDGTRLGVPSIRPGGAYNTNGGTMPDMAFSADGLSLAVVYGSGGAEVFDVATRASKGAALPATLVSGSSLFFTPDGKRLVVAGDRAVYVIDWATGTRVFPPLAHGGQVYEAALSRDGAVLLTNCADGLARLWDMKTGRLLAEPTLQQPQYAPAIQSPESSEVILFASDGPAYRLRAAGEAQSLALPSPYSLSRATFLRDPPNRVLRLVGSRAMAIEVATGHEATGGFAYPVNLGVTLNIRTLLTRDHQTVIVREGGGQGADIATGRGWSVWRRDTNGKVVQSMTLEGVPQNPNLAIGSKGDLVAVSGPAMPGQAVGIWSLETGRKLAEIKRDLGILAGATFSADERSIGFVTADNAVHVADYPGDKDRFVLRGSDRTRITSWIFSPDGTRIVTADSSGGVQFWRAADGVLLRKEQRHRDLASVEGFSPDGRLLVSHSVDGTAQVWDVASGLPTGGLLAHQGELVLAIFNPSGTGLATLTRRGDLRFWDVASGQPLSEPLRHEGSQNFSGSGVKNFAFEPRGRFLMSWGNNPEIYRVWPVPPDGGGAPAPPWLLRLATICASKRLTEDGEFVSAADEVARIDEVRRELSALPNDAPFVEWGRWFLAESATRSIAPGFTIMAGEARKIAEEMAAIEPLQALTLRSNQLRRQKKWAEAEAVDRQALEFVRARDGQESKAVSDQMIRLAQTLVLGGKFVEAETLARACLAMRLKYYNADDSPMPDARGTLAESLLGQKRYSEAEPLFVSTYDESKALIASGAMDVARVTTTAQSLAQLYGATNQPEKAAEWTRKAAETATAPAAPGPNAPPPPTPNP